MDILGESNSSSSWLKIVEAYDRKYEKKNIKMVAPDFLGENIEIDSSKLFPILVMATMSSGKSTLINALLGKDILPSKNEACTAKKYSILLDNGIAKEKAYITEKSGIIKIVENNLLEKLTQANESEEVKEVLVVSKAEEIINAGKSLLIIDTPGPNNSRDNSHEIITNNILNKINGGMLLYIINATQMGIKDDEKFLSMVREYLEKNKGMNIVFVVNKIDELDLEKESIEDLIYDTKSYIEAKGVKNPNVVPVSALAAKLFRKVLNGELLTRKQYHDFVNAYEIFGPKNINLATYALTKDGSDFTKFITVNDKEYRVAELVGALNNTGITYLERYIGKTQILNERLNPVKIKVNCEGRI